jgi:hypothetical protein
LSYIGLAAGTVLILAAVRYKVNVGIAAAVAGLIVAATSGGGIAILTESLGEAVLEPAGLTLLASIAFITMIGNIMRVSGALDDLTQGIGRVIRDARVVAFVLPSLVGLLSVPGSSVFSAPLVDSVGRTLGMSREQRVTTNVMFRHAWYYVYPIYAPLLMIQQISGVPYSAFVLPGSIAALVVFAMTARRVFRTHPSAAEEAHLPVDGSSTQACSCSDCSGVRTSACAGANAGNEPTTRSHAFMSTHPVRSILVAASPILVVLLVGVGTPINFSIATALGALTALFAAPTHGPYLKEVARRIREGAVPGVNWKVVGTVAGTVFFSKTIINSGVLASMAVGTGSSVSVLSLFIFGLALPFLSGFIIGAHLPAIGISGPLLVPLLSGLPNPAGLVVALYMAASSGYLLSPAHVCFISTVQYLKADVRSSWRMLWGPGGAGLLLGLLFWAVQVAANLL